MGQNDINSLSHTRWNCKYHIVFAPKYRRKVFYQEKKAAIGKILRQLCEWKGVKIIEAEACPNHIHLFVEIPPKMSVSHFMGYLKGKSSTMLYEQFGELKYKYRIPEPRILVQRVLCGHSREKREPNCGVCEEPTKRGRDGRTTENPI